MYLFVHVSSCEYKAFNNAYRFDVRKKKKKSYMYILE